MRSIPVTTRLKSAPKKVAVGKKTPDPKAKVYGNNQDDPKEIIENISSSYEGEKMSKEEWAALTPKQRRDLNAAAGANKEGKIIKQKKKIIPGEKTYYEGTLMTTTKGTVLKPTDVRRLSRSSKKANRDIRRSEIKLSKYGTRQEDGTWKENSGLSARQSAKFRENKRELTNFENIASNVEKGTESGQGFGKSFVSGQRERQQSELGKDLVSENAQKKMLKNKNEAAKRANLISSSNNGGQASKAIDTGNNAAEDSSETGFNYERFTGEAGMRNAIRSALSPRALGDNNTVKKPSPQKLAPLAAIAGKALVGAVVNKAVSGMKKRSGFKMKGYGKK